MRILSGSCRGSSVVSLVASVRVWSLRLSWLPLCWSIPCVYSCERWRKFGWSIGRCNGGVSVSTWRGFCSRWRLTLRRNTRSIKKSRARLPLRSLKGRASQMRGNSQCNQSQRTEGRLSPSHKARSLHPGKTPTFSALTRVNERRVNDYA